MIISLPAFIQNMMDSIYLFDTFTLVFLAFWGIFAVSWYAKLFFIKRHHCSTPPGPPGLPLIGNLLSLDLELHKYFATLSQTYGPIFSLRLGAKYGIVISFPSMACQVLKDHDIIFANRDVPVASRVVTYGGCDVAFSPYGSEWRMLRKVLVQWIVTSTTALGSTHTLRRNHEVQKTMSYLYSRVGSPVDIGELMFLTVLNMSTSIIWGGTVEGDERTVLGGEFRELMTNVLELLGKPNLSDFFPLLAWFDLQGVEKQMHLLVQKFDQIFEKIIKQKLKKKKEISGSEAEEGRDFLEFMFRLKDEQKDSKTQLTMANIKALLVNVVIGGTDTSSNTIEFAMAHMISKPEVMRRVQEELDNIVGKNNMVQESHIQNLPYLHAVMKETLRLHPAVPLLVPHTPSETTNVEGYTIPKGSRVFVNLWAIHRDPSIWDNPQHFDPTRFLGDAKYDYKGNDFSYLPFGSGRRICPGTAMAERTFLYCVATLVHFFEWKVPSGQTLDTSEKFGLTLKKKTPLVAIPTPRLSNLVLYE